MACNQKGSLPGKGKGKDFEEAVNNALTQADAYGQTVCRVIGGNCGEGKHCSFQMAEFEVVSVEQTGGGQPRVVVEVRVVGRCECQPDR